MVSLIPKTLWFHKPPSEVIGLISELDGVVVCRPQWMQEGKIPIFSSVGRWEVLTPKKRENHNHFLHPYQTLWIIQTTLYGSSLSLPGVRFSFGWDQESTDKETFLERLKKDFPQDFLWLTLHPEVLKGYYYEEDSSSDQDF